MLNTNTSYIIIYETNKLIKRVTFVESYSASTKYLCNFDIYFVVRS